MPTTPATPAIPDNNDDNEINLTPMLDVVFIMLIFFIVTATFIKETGIDVNRPDAITPSPVDSVGVLVAISANDEVWIDGRMVDVRALRATIRRLHSENPLGAVVIQADEDSTNGAFVRVMDAIRQAGIDDIAIAADNR